MAKSTGRGRVISEISGEINGFLNLVTGVGNQTLRLVAPRWVCGGSVQPVAVTSVEPSRVGEIVVPFSRQPRTPDIADRALLRSGLSFRYEASDELAERTKVVPPAEWTEVVPDREYPKLDPR